MKRQILVLGATGLLGPAIAHVAKSRGFEVRLAARRSHDIALDISNQNELAEVLAKVNPDLVINCAALVDVRACEDNPSLAWATNTRPLSLLTEWSNATNRRFVHISTDHYFTEGGNRAHDEFEAVQIVNEYARSKYAAELIALQSPTALVLRTSIVGKRGWESQTFAEFAVDVAENDRSAVLFSDVYTSSIDTYSFANSTFDLIEKNVVGLLNLAASEIYTKEQFVLELARQANKNLTRVTIGSGENLIPQRPKSLGLSVQRSEFLLGYALPKLDEVVRSVLIQMPAENLS